MLHESFEVEIIVCGLDPKAPIEIFQKGDFQQVELLQGHTPDIGYEVVAIENVVVEF